MRTYVTLDNFSASNESDIIYVSTQQESEHRPIIALRREGDYLAISASYGPLEIALRPRLQELVQTLNTLRPVAGLNTTRQIGTGQAYLSLGLSDSGILLIRPTIVADATGHVSFNLKLSAEARAQLYQWLGAETSA